MNQLKLFHEDKQGVEESWDLSLISSTESIEPLTKSQIEQLPEAHSLIESLEMEEIRPRESFHVNQEEKVFSIQNIAENQSSHKNEENKQDEEIEKEGILIENDNQDNIQSLNVIKEIAEEFVEQIEESSTEEPEEENLRNPFIQIPQNKMFPSVKQRMESSSLLSPSKTKGYAVEKPKIRTNLDFRDYFNRKQVLKINNYVKAEKGGKTLGGKNETGSKKKGKFLSRALYKFEKKTDDGIGNFSFLEEGKGKDKGVNDVAELEKSQIINFKKVLSPVKVKKDSVSDVRMSERKKKVRKRLKKKKSVVIVVPEERSRAEKPPEPSPLYSKKKKGVVKPKKKKKVEKGRKGKRVIKKKKKIRETGQTPKVSKQRYQRTLDTLLTKAERQFSQANEDLESLMSESSEKSRTKLEANVQKYTNTFVRKFGELREATRTTLDRLQHMDDQLLKTRFEHLSKKMEGMQRSVSEKYRAMSDRILRQNTFDELFPSERERPRESRVSEAWKKFELPKWSDEGSGGGGEKDVFFNEDDSFPSRVAEIAKKDERRYEKLLGKFDYQGLKDSLIGLKSKRKRNAEELGLDDSLNLDEKNFACFDPRAIEDEFEAFSLSRQSELRSGETSFDKSQMPSPSEIKEMESRLLQFSVLGDQKRVEEQKAEREKKLRELEMEQAEKIENEIRKKELALREKELELEREKVLIRVEEEERIRMQKREEEDARRKQRERVEEEKNQIRRIVNERTSQDDDGGFERHQYSREKGDEEEMSGFQKRIQEKYKEKTQVENEEDDEKYEFEYNIPKGLIYTNPNPPKLEEETVIDPLKKRERNRIDVVENYNAREDFAETVRGIAGEVMSESMKKLSSALFSQYMEQEIEGIAESTRKEEEEEDEEEVEIVTKKFKPLQAHLYSPEFIQYCINNKIDFKDNNVREVLRELLTEYAEEIVSGEGEDQEVSRAREREIAVDDAVGRDELDPERKKKLVLLSTLMLARSALSRQIDTGVFDDDDDESEVTQQVPDELLRSMSPYASPLLSVGSASGSYVGGANAMFSVSDLQPSKRIVTEDVTVERVEREIQTLSKPKKEMVTHDTQTMKKSFATSMTQVQPDTLESRAQTSPRRLLDSNVQTTQLDTSMKETQTFEEEFEEEKDVIEDDGRPGLLPIENIREKFVVSSIEKNLKSELTQRSLRYSTEDDEDDENDLFQSYNGNFSSAIKDAFTGDIPLESLDSTIHRNDTLEKDSHEEGDDEVIYRNASSSPEPANTSMNASASAKTRSIHKKFAVSDIESRLRSELLAGSLNYSSDESLLSGDSDMSQLASSSDNSMIVIEYDDDEKSVEKRELLLE